MNYIIDHSKAPSDMLTLESIELIRSSYPSMARASRKMLLMYDYHIKTCGSLNSILRFNRDDIERSSLLMKAICFLDTHSPSYLSDLEILLNNNADVNTHNPQNGRTALMCCENNLVAIDLLMKFGAINTIDAKDKEHGNTSLYRLIDGVYFEGVESLINYGASVLIRNNNGETALDVCERSRLKLLKHLPNDTVIIQKFIEAATEAETIRQSVKLIEIDVVIHQQQAITQRKRI